jgi:excinuclease UvrABC nuclease subunit
MTSEGSENSYTLDIPDIGSLPSVAYDDRRSLPTGSGVYFVSGPLGAVLYIGSSKNLRTRWSGHHRKHQLAVTGGVRIAWISVDHAAHRLALEHHCIEVLRPLYQQSSMPQRRDKNGHIVFDVTVHLPQSLFERIYQASQDYNRTLPNQILFILKRLMHTGQMEKWSKSPHERSRKGNVRQRRSFSSKQMRLFTK